MCFPCCCSGDPEGGGFLQMGTSKVASQDRALHKTVLVLIDPELLDIITRVREVFGGIMDRLASPPSTVFVGLGEMGLQRVHLEPRYDLILYVGPMPRPNEAFGKTMELVRHVEGSSETPIFYLPRGVWEVRAISLFIANTLNIPLKQNNWKSLSTKL